MHEMTGMVHVLSLIALVELFIGYLYRLKTNIICTAVHRVLLRIHNSSAVPHSSMITRMYHTTSIFLSHFSLDCVNAFRA